MTVTFRGIIRLAYMNWHQRFNVATPVERDRVAQTLLNTIAKQENSWVFANGIWIKERRRLPIDKLSG